MVLKSGVSTAHRISEFYKWNNDQRLILAPRYQRNVIWTPRSKSYLMDTILENLPVPEVFVNIITNTKGTTIYTVVDGQQRIDSILKFIDNQFRISESESTNFKKLNFDELSDEDRQNFWDYPIVTRELQSSTESDITDIFKRMNKYVMPLNSQEIRHATYRGSFITFAEKIAENDFWISNKIFSTTEIKRMIDIEFVSDLIISLILGVFEKKQEKMSEFYKKYDEKFDEMLSLEKRIKNILFLIDEIFDDQLRKSPWKSKTSFYALFLALDMIKNQSGIEIPSNKFFKLKSELISFSQDVELEFLKNDLSSGNKIANNFAKTIMERSYKAEQRSIRIDITKELILSCL